jgi:hypothetical protein
MMIRTLAASFSVTLLFIFAVNAQGFAVVRSTSSTSSLRSKAAFVSSVRSGGTGGGAVSVGGLTLSSSSASSTSSEETTTDGIPSWESLETDLEDFRSNVEEGKQPPMLTLYR